jgi:cbb3-type cytochrome oxidase maturation protein
MRPLDSRRSRRPDAPAMDILLLLIPLSVVLALAIGGAFAWCVTSGQLDDLEGPAQRIVSDDDRAS